MLCMQGSCGLLTKPSFLCIIAMYTTMPLQNSTYVTILCNIAVPHLVDLDLS